MRHTRILVDLERGGGDDVDALLARSLILAHGGGVLNFCCPVCLLLFSPSTERRCDHAHVQDDRSALQCGLQRARAGWKGDAGHRKFGGQWTMSTPAMQWCLSDSDAAL